MENEIANTVVNDRQVVSECDACPNCGNRHMDTLVWEQPQFGEWEPFVKCWECNTSYVP